MAEDWIKMRRGLRQDPKVIAMARGLSQNRAFMEWIGGPSSERCHNSVTEIVTFGIVTRVTVAALLDVWAALNHSIKADGKAHWMRLQDVDEISEVPGIGEAMKAVGWIIERKDKSLVFPNFFENNTPIKERKSEAKTDAQRAKEYRERKRAEKQEMHTVTASRHVTTDKNRLDKNTLSPLPPPGAERENDYSDKMPTPAAKRMRELEKKIQSLKPDWKTAFSYREMELLAQNARAIDSLSESDWQALRDWLWAKLPKGEPDERARYRSKLLEWLPDQVAKAMEWDRKRKRDRPARPTIAPATPRRIMTPEEEAEVAMILAGKSQ